MSAFGWLFERKRRSILGPSLRDFAIYVGCTGGRHRRVTIASEIRKRLAAAGYGAKETHRDLQKK